MTLQNFYDAANDTNEVFPERLFHHDYHGGSISGELSGVELDWERNTRVKVYEVWEYDCADGRRDAKVWTAFLDSKPFMVVQAAGRDAQKDSFDMFISDAEAYKEAIGYLATLASFTRNEIETHSATEYIEHLDHLYGQTILPEDLGKPTRWGIWQKNERTREMQEAGEEIPETWLTSRW